MNKVLLYFVLSILIVKVFNDACSSKDDEEVEDSVCRQLEITVGTPSEEYICIKNTDSTGCKEEKLCQFQGEKDDCSGYPTLDGYKCIKTAEGNCDIEQIICGEETKTDTDLAYCQKLKVDNGYKCIKGDTKCESQQINCGEEGDGNGSSDLCKLLKVDDDEHKACVKDENEAKCIVAINCGDVKVDATDEICAKFNVENGKKCLKEGVTCAVKTICDGAEGSTDDDCKDLWVTNSNTKKCVKKSEDNKCEEISKAEEEQTPNTQATEAQPTQQQTPNTQATEAQPTQQPTQNTQAAQNSQTTNSETTSSSNKATKSSNKSSSLDGIKISLMILIIMLIL